MIVRLPSRSIVSLLVNAPSVVIAKLLKLVKPVKESLVWVKSSVRIKFKLSDETVAALEISAKFGTSIVMVSALIVAPAILLKVSSINVTVKLTALIVDALLKK